MKKIVLKKVEHDIKMGQVCEYIEPNVTDDCIFVDDGEIIGFYLKDIAKHSTKAAKLATLANFEFRSKNVPKTNMTRSGTFVRDTDVQQYSTILGAVPPKPLVRRYYATMSSVHNHKPAQTFIKAMLMLAIESEKIIQKITPEIYDRQKKIIDENISEKWRFGNLFTSSISNFNIAANYHQDNANLKGCVNVIISKREHSTGGCTTIPDYGATVNSGDNSMLVYPAWRNLHGVTPIVPTKKGGYRNTLVFYPLKAFKNLD